MLFILCLVFDTEQSQFLLLFIMCIYLFAFSLEVTGYIHRNVTQLKFQATVCNKTYIGNMYPEHLFGADLKLDLNIISCAFKL